MVVTWRTEELESINTGLLLPIPKSPHPQVPSGPERREETGRHSNTLNLSGYFNRSKGEKYLLNFQDTG